MKELTSKLRFYFVVIFLLGAVAGSTFTGGTRAQISPSPERLADPESQSLADYKIIQGHIDEDQKLNKRVTIVAERARAVIKLKLQGWQNWSAELEILRWTVQTGRARPHSRASCNDGGDALHHARSAGCGRSGGEIRPWQQPDSALLDAIQKVPETARSQLSRSTGKRCGRI